MTDGLRYMYNHDSTSLDDPSVGQSEIDWDLKASHGGMTWPACKQFLAILQVCWYCLA